MAECKYCNGEKLVIHGDYTDLVINTRERLISAWADGEANLKINYCPMCGRKLGDQDA